MNAKRKLLYCYAMLILTVLLLAPLPAVSQDHGSGGGGGCGDVFGDLIHILRDNLTGQPILAQRWVELPAEVQGYGWGYCPIAVNSDGEELGFLPYSCDINPEDLGEVVEVNYFGRLNGGRTKERNNRMHFDEVISNIQAGDLVTTGPAGRMVIGYGCKVNGDGKAMLPCDELAAIDSPMEHMGLYSRTMRYGHLATDPYEIDTWAHGDPKLTTPFHVALRKEDFAKFPAKLKHLLPNNGKDLEGCWDYDAAETFTDSNEDDIFFAGEPFFDINKNCVRDEHEPFSDVNLDGFFNPAEDFEDTNKNCVRDEFVFTCAGAETLQNNDFISGAVSMAAAASKTGKITTHLTQYFNRILKIAKDTEHTVSTLDTLPALYRDCWDGDDEPPPIGEGPWETDLEYDTCTIYEAYIPEKSADYCDLGTPNHCLFPDLQERFVDYSGLDGYVRESSEMNLLLSTSGTWAVEEDVNLNAWVQAVNGNKYNGTNIDGAVAATRDFLRTIEYIHNYEVPLILECVYDTDLCPTP